MITFLKKTYRQGIKKGMCVEARLAKLLDDHYFFFGAMIIHKKKNLAFIDEYTIASLATIPRLKSGAFFACL